MRKKKTSKPLFQCQKKVFTLPRYPPHSATLDQQTIKNLRETTKASEQAALAARPKKKQKRGGASKREPPKTTGEECGFTAADLHGKNFRVRDTKPGRQHYLNLQYLKKNMDHASTLVELQTVTRIAWFNGCSSSRPSAYALLRLQSWQ